jgi:hypothetical protein
MTKPLAPATKADIRADFEKSPQKYSGLSERAQHSIVSRGQVAEDAIKVFNRGRKGHRRYVRGQGLAVKATTAAQRQRLVDAGLAGKRGPLSKAALAALKG